MEKIDNISPETKKILADKYLMDSEDNYQLKYKIDGAEVYIHYNDEKGKNTGNDFRATINVVKHVKDDQGNDVGNVLTFEMSEQKKGPNGSIIETAAWVHGLPIRTDSDDPRDGMRALRYYKEEDQKQSEDMFVRASQIYGAYEKETKGKIAIQTAFEKYVPDTYEGLQRYFDNQEKMTAKQKKETEVYKQQVLKFQKDLGNF